MKPDGTDASAATDLPSVPNQRLTFVQFVMWIAPRMGRHDRTRVKRRNVRRISRCDEHVPKWIQAPPLVSSNADTRLWRSLVGDTNGFENGFRRRRSKGRRGERIQSQLPFQTLLLSPVVFLPPPLDRSVSDNNSSESESHRMGSSRGWIVFLRGSDASKREPR